MALSKERLAIRNADIRKQYAAYKKKYPQWRTDAVMELVAKDFYLSTIRISRILFSKECDTVVRFVQTSIMFQPHP